MERKRVDYYPGIFDPYKSDMNMEHWIEVLPFTKWKIPFPEVMWGLGFEMDSFNGFMEKNPRFVSTNLEDINVKKQILEVLKESDVSIVGSFLFSFFRQKTHWDYTSALTPEEEQFVLIVFSILEYKLENIYEGEGSANTMKKDVVKIVVKGESGYGTLSDAYHGVLTITPNGTSYKYTPEEEREDNKPFEWSYKAKGEGYTKAYEDIVRNLNVILRPKDIPSACDVGELKIIVTYADKTKETRSYFATADSFPEFFNAIRSVIPFYEGTPFFAILYDDDWR